MSKFCTNCGASLTEEQQMCQNCGAAVTPNTNSTVQNSTTTVNNGQGKSKIAAGLLGIFLGGLGVHNFYLGYTGKAVGQLLLSVLTCGLLSPISGIWGLVEGIMILTGSINTDANGNPLTD